jgi:hypothetical protein
MVKKIKKFKPNFSFRLHYAFLILMEKQFGELPICSISGKLDIIGQYFLEKEKLPT